MALKENASSETMVVLVCCLFRVIALLKSVDKILFETRMHSSGMCTSRLLTVSQHPRCRGGSAQGGYLLGGLPSGGCLPRRGVSAQGECIPACNGADNPPPVWTDRHL